MSPEPTRDAGRFCVPCWLNLGHCSDQDRRANPLEVLRADPEVTGGHGREFLAKELIVLADLVTSHSEEFSGRAAARGCTHGA